MKIRLYRPKNLIFGIITSIAGEIVYYKTHVDRGIAVAIIQIGAILVGTSFRSP